MIKIIKVKLFIKKVNFNIFIVLKINLFFKPIVNIKDIYYLYIIIFLKKKFNIN